jgi:hypothetical protein
MSAPSVAYGRKISCQTEGARRNQPTNVRATRINLLVAQWGRRGVEELALTIAQTLMGIAVLVSFRRTEHVVATAVSDARELQPVGR